MVVSPLYLPKIGIQDDSNSRLPRNVEPSNFRMKLKLGGNNVGGDSCDWSFLRPFEDGEPACLPPKRELGLASETSHSGVLNLNSVALGDCSYLIVPYRERDFSGTVGERNGADQEGNPVPRGHSSHFRFLDHNRLETYILPA